MIFKFLLNLESIWHIYCINICIGIFTTGKGTTHCTNGIVIQCKPLTCALPPGMTSVNHNRSKNRSITCIPTDVLPYHSGPRRGPNSLNIDVSTVTQASPDAAAYARVIDFGWMLCRQPIEDTLFSCRQSRPGNTSMDRLQHVAMRGQYSARMLHWLLPSY